MKFASRSLFSLAAAVAMIASTSAQSEVHRPGTDPYNLRPVSPVVLEPGAAAEDYYGTVYHGSGRGYLHQPHLQAYGPRILDQRRPLTSFYLDTQSTRLIDLRRTLNVRRANYFRHGNHGYQTPYPYIPTHGAVTTYRNPFFHDSAVTREGMDATPTIDSPHYGGSDAATRPGVKSDEQALRAEDASPEAIVEELNPTHAGQISVASGQVLIRTGHGEGVLLTEK